MLSSLLRLISKFCPSQKQMNERLNNSQTSELTKNGQKKTKKSLNKRSRKAKLFKARRATDKISLMKQNLQSKLSSNQSKRSKNIFNKKRRSLLLHSRRRILNPIIINFKKIPLIQKNQERMTRRNMTAKNLTIQMMKSEHYRIICLKNDEIQVNFIRFTSLLHIQSLIYC